MYKRIIRPVFFLFDPEHIHHFVMFMLRIAGKTPLLRRVIRNLYSYRGKTTGKEVFGIYFPNPVGLAAGLDKNAIAVDGLALLGFGFIEIGTLTPEPQSGNPKKRLFRLKKDKALINRMGFNNAGAAQAAKQLKNRKSKIIVGVNIGKNKTTPNENAKEDYLKSFRMLFDYADYFTVNVSSPNTPGLRELQEAKPLTEILTALQEENERMTVRKPILLKIAPDLTDSQLLDIIDIVQKTGIDGVIATNTSTGRENLSEKKEKIEKIGAGGLSGMPIKNRSTEVIRFIAQHSNKSFPIIGVGGIHSPGDALEKLQAGADLIQIYTGFIYEGPGLVKRILNKIATGKTS